MSTVATNSKQDIYGSEVGIFRWYNNYISSGLEDEPLKNTCAVIYNVGSEACIFVYRIDYGCCGNSYNWLWVWDLWMLMSIMIT